MGLNLHVNMFDKSVKHLHGYGMPVAVKRIDRRRGLLILKDNVVAVNAEELVSTVEDIMRVRA